MTLNRRSILTAGAGLGATAAALSNASAATLARSGIAPIESKPGHDQSGEVQALIDDAARTGAPVVLPPGRFRVSDLRLRAGTTLIGAGAATTLEFGGGAAFITAERADDITLEGLVFDGRYAPIDDARGEGLISIVRAERLRIARCDVRHGTRNGILLTDVSGNISGVRVGNVLDAGIKSIDARGLAIEGNTIQECGNNGIQVWRSTVGEDGTTVTGNRISRVTNRRGGTGEYGNGINVFRAGGVMVANNRVTDCTYSAIRANSSSNVQIVSNNCERSGEVAIYAEFAFEGALIANNLIDTAATGVSVVNFDRGGRLAVVQGNLIRNLFRREHEAQDKRGEGIQVEADTAVTGNVIEGAPTAGIRIGWGPYMRDVSATGNIIRNAATGILISNTPGAGQCLVANNMISGARDGAIREATYDAAQGAELAGAPSKGSRVTSIGNVAM